MASPSTEPAAAPDLVLASASPRRRDLLCQVGVRHVVRVADVDESPLPGETPRDYVQRLAQAKAAAVVALGEHALPVLGADTTVVLDGDILGKPRDAADALAMLRRLSGREHEVYTAVALCVPGEAPLDPRLALSVTRVRFRAVDDALLARYVASGEPLDKAGAYGIQGLGAALVARIEGSYSGVVGLPLAETVELLVAAGVPVLRHD